MISRQENGREFDSAKSLEDVQSARKKLMRADNSGNQHAKKTLERISNSRKNINSNLDNEHQLRQRFGRRR